MGSRAEQQQCVPDSVDDRRRSARVQLTGAALLGRKDGSVSAVLDNVNRIGAGFHAKEELIPKESLTATLAFLDQDGHEQQEKLGGSVAWTKPWEKGYLIGVVWDQVVTKENNRWLSLYLDGTLKKVG